MSSERVYKCHRNHISSNIFEAYDNESYTYSMTWYTIDEDGDFHPLKKRCFDRIRQMDNDMIRIDTLVRTALKLPPDVARIARADGKKDVRKD